MRISGQNTLVYRPNTKIHSQESIYSCIYSVSGYILTSYMSIFERVLLNALLEVLFDVPSVSKVFKKFRKAGKFHKIFFLPF